MPTQELDEMSRDTGHSRILTGAHEKNSALSTIISHLYFLRLFTIWQGAKNIKSFSPSTTAENTAPSTDQR